MQKGLARGYCDPFVHFYLENDEQEKLQKLFLSIQEPEIMVISDSVKKAASYMYLLFNILPKFKIFLRLSYPSCVDFGSIRMI